MDGTAFELVKAVFLLGVVLVFVWFTTRLLGHRISGVGKGRALRVLEQVSAGRDRSIILVEVGSRIYLVGSTAEQLNLLDAIADPTAVRQIVSAIPSADATSPLRGWTVPTSFRQVLDKALQRSGLQLAVQPAPNPEPEPTIVPRQGVPDTAGEQAAHLRAQMERLRQLKDR